MITHVAIRFGGKIWSLPKPNRHHHVIYKIVRELDVDTVDGGERDQGFLDDTGRYLTRTQALMHAKESGQVPREHRNPRGLFSEDVW